MENKKTKCSKCGCKRFSIESEKENIKDLKASYNLLKEELKKYSD